MNKMNFSEQSVQNTLPQFSEISSRTNSSTSNYASNENNHLQSEQNIVFTTTSEVTSSNKFPNAVLNWSDHNTLIQLCEKQGIQTINIPAYSQNNIITAQSHGMPMRVISTSYVPQINNETEKNNSDEAKVTSEADNEQSGSQSLQQQSVVMAEYLQKFQSTSLPISLQQFIKFQSENTKKEKSEEQKNDQIQSNILNIPSVPMYKNTQIQSDNNFINNDHSMISLNPSDVNVHIEDQTENAGMQHQTQNQSQNQTQTKVSQTVLSEMPKPEKKIKFRAKTGEIKTSIAIDGTTLYCCPECSLVFAQKSEVEQHLQIHVQERKFQCKECGAMLKRKEHLDQHMRGHSDERPFKCPICQKAFKRNEHLTRHYVIHSGDKNFSCQVCQKAFSRKDHLNKHIQTHLANKKSKPSKKDSTSDPVADATSAATMLFRQDINNLLKDSNLKQDTTHLLQHIQNLQKDSNLLQTFSSFKEHMLNGPVFQQQAVNMNEILPQNTRYLMPS